MLNHAPLTRTEDSAERVVPWLLKGALIVAGTLGLLTYHFTANLQLGALVLALGAVAVALLEYRDQNRTSEKREAVARAVDNLAKGDVSIRLDPATAGEYAPFARAFNNLAASTGSSAARLSQLKLDLLELPDQIEGVLADVNHGADDQEAAVEETSSLLANINTSIRGINSEINTLASSNDETSSAIMEMRSAIEQIAANSTALRDTVESSTSAVHELNAQIGRVSESGDAVQQVAEETAVSITEMDQAIREVGAHVRGAAELTEQVTESADEGARAVGATIEGSTQIRNLTNDAKTTLEALATRIGEISEIASVINGISDETNLLSLNAAIIAAQAGEHGRAFAVVAEQVKTLARRTTTSTQEIELLIASVEEQSEKAVRAMAAGIEAVEQGVARSRGAGEALERIRGAASDASGRVAEISRAAEDQARNSRHVAESAQRTSEQVQQISLALTDQKKATEQILQNSTESLEMTRQMSVTTEEQLSSSRYISENIASVSELIGSIQTKTASHEEASRSLEGAMMSIFTSIHKTGERIPEALHALASLRDKSEAVGAESAGSERDPENS